MVRLRALFRTAAEQSAQLLLGAIDHRGPFGYHHAFKFSLTEEIELLAGRVEREPVAIGDRQRCRLRVVIDRVVLPILDQRELRLGSERPIVLVALGRCGRSPADAGGNQVEGEPAVPAGDVLPNPLQGQRVDSRIVIAGSGTKCLDIGGGGAFDCSRRITRRDDGVELALRMRVPNLRPLILPSAGEEPQGLAVLAFVGETAKAFASLGVALGAAQSDALELARLDIVRLELARAFKDIKRIARPVEPAKRARRCAQRLEFEYAVWCFLSEHQNVARPLLAPRHLDAALPCLERLPELVDVADFEGLPVRLSEVGELLIDRARPPPAPSAEGRLDCFLERIALRFDAAWSA